MHSELLIVPIKFVYALAPDVSIPGQTSMMNCKWPKNRN